MNFVRANANANALRGGQFNFPLFLILYFCVCNCRRLASNFGQQKRPPLSWAFIQPPTVATAHSHARPIGDPSKCECVWFTRSFGCSLSLSIEEAKSTFCFIARIRANFKGLLKVSGVATNRWVFLRCDWLPVSS